MRVVGKEGALEGVFLLWPISIVSGAFGHITTRFILQTPYELGRPRGWKVCSTEAAQPNL